MDSECVYRSFQPLLDSSLDYLIQQVSAKRSSRRYLTFCPKVRFADFKKHFLFSFQMVK